jgi:hypothetical protein
MFLQITLAAEAHLEEDNFTRKADIEQRTVSDIPRTNSKTNGNQNRRAEFRATVNLRKEERIKVIDTSSSVR